MADELSGVAVIICISFGVLTFFILFIFANRQIKRFSLKTRSGPHFPVAHDAPKVVQQEIDRLLGAIKGVSYQPVLLKTREESLFLQPDIDIQCHLYRMKALDSLTTLESTVVSLDPIIGRLFRRDLRHCLMRLFYKGVLHSVKTGLINRFSDMYEFARHEPGHFTYESFGQFMSFLHLVQQCISQSVLEPPSVEHFNGNLLSVPGSGRNYYNRKISNGSLPRTPPEESKVTYETSV